jgi:hypothetical protein
MLALGLVLAASAATADDWPMFRKNPLHTGVSESPDATPIRPRRLWSYAITEGITFSSPAVSNGMVYLGSNFSTDCRTPGRVYAFSTVTGALVWSFATSGSIGDATPAVINGTVVIGAGDTVYGLHALTGAVRWRRSYPGFCFMENFVTAAPSQGLVFLGGVKIVGQIGYVFALTAAGQEWFSPVPIDKAGETSSAVFGAPTHVGSWGLLVFSSYNKRVFGISDGTGSLRWMNDAPMDGLYATVAYDSVEDRLYAGSFDGSLYCLDLNGNTRWAFQTGGRVISSPAVVWTSLGTRIIFGSEDGYVYALRSNGTEAWRFPAGAAVYSSVAVSGAGPGGQPHVYFATARGAVYVLDTNGNVVDDPNVPTMLLGSLTWSSTAIAGRRLYIATAGLPSRFYILGETALQPSWITTSGNLRSADVGVFGDNSARDHTPGVSLWPSSSQWGQAALVNGRSARGALVSAPRFLMNLTPGSEDLQRQFVLRFTYRTNGTVFVYQYDGVRYHVLGSMPGDGTWRVGQVVTNPAWYQDYPSNPADGINVLLKVERQGGTYYYLDKIEMFRQTSAPDFDPDGEADETPADPESADEPEMSGWQVEPRAVAVAARTEHTR